ncbi:hypothetical protein GCM10027048_29940 [Hymenobacter coalescens]
MNKLYSRVATLLVAAAALASCGRSQYAFKSGAASYHETAAHPAAPIGAEEAPEARPAAELTASAAPVTASSPVRRVAAPAPQPRTATRVAGPAEAKAAQPLTPAAQKALRREVKQAVKQAARQSAAAPAAEGKSQLTALLLCIFLSSFGVHRFYLGYTGRGLLYIALLLTSWLIIPLLVLAVLTTIDLIKIITGDLKPKNGEYAKTFSDMNKEAK